MKGVCERVGKAVSSREPRVARIKRQYPFLVPASVLGLAVFIIYAVGSMLVFLWGVSMPLAGR